MHTEYQDHEIAKTHETGRALCLLTKAGRAIDSVRREHMSVLCVSNALCGAVGFGSRFVSTMFWLGLAHINGGSDGSVSDSGCRGRSSRRHDCCSLEDRLPECQRRGLDLPRVLEWMVLEVAVVEARNLTVTLSETAIGDGNSYGLLGQQSWAKNEHEPRCHDMLGRCNGRTKIWRNVVLLNRPSAGRAARHAA